MQDKRATSSTLPGRTHNLSAHSVKIPPELLRGMERLADGFGTTIEAIALTTLRILVHCYGYLHDVSIEVTTFSATRFEQVVIQPRLAVNHPIRKVLETVIASLWKGGQARPSPPGENQSLLCSFEYFEAGRRDESYTDAESKYPFAIALRAVRTRDELLLTFYGRHDIVAADTVQYCAASYVHLARQIASNVTLTVGELELVPNDQRRKLLGSFIDTHFPTRAEVIDDLFRACVDRVPDNRAVTYQGHSLTYAQLEQRADALARYLVCNGLEVGDRVAIQMEPSIDIAVALLGSLRAGATYLPIDRELPVERAHHLLSDSGARFLIGEQDTRDSLAFNGHFIDLARVDIPHNDRAPLPTLRPGDCAYLIYTSGTTGEPKGAQIEHHSLLNYVEWFRTRYNIDSSRRAALLTSYAFDLGYTVLWTTLLSGGELHFLPSSVCKNPASILTYVRDHEIDFIKVTPSLLSALVRSNTFSTQSCAHLRLIVTGGEPVRVSDIKATYACCPGAEIVNHYGPTETTIGAITHPIPRNGLQTYSKQPVIGRPIGNVRAYVTSPDLALVPIGAPGELLIGGRGVGRGYHARESLTKEKFIPDPFEPGGISYRTGDLVRWTHEGTIEFLGRMDRQVKIRGFRVELAEIEQVMLRRLELRDVVVINKALSPSNYALCAYYVGEQRLEPSDARENLRQALPPYMVPLSLTKVSSIPRSANGKLDIAQLPEPTFENSLQQEDAPQNDTEATLLELWTEILGIDRIGVSQNFLQLGGHSLLMVQLIAEIQSRFDVMIPISLFFGEGTIRALASFIHGDN